MLRIQPKANVQRRIQRVSQLSQHAEGMPLIVGTLQSADRRRRRSHLFREFSLSEARLLAQGGDLSGDRIQVDPSLGTPANSLGH